MKESFLTRFRKAAKEHPHAIRCNVSASDYWEYQRIYRENQRVGNNNTCDGVQVWCDPKLKDGEIVFG